MIGAIRDYHVHSSNSIDSSAAMEQYCQAALKKQVVEIAFTEHFDLHPLEEGNDYFNYDKYNREVEECSRKYGEKVKILKGLELGEPHLFPREHINYLKDKDFDFLLGSVHWVEDQALHLDYCKNKEVQQAYETYFSNVFQAARSGTFDILAHLDLLKRYAPDSFGQLVIEDYRDIVMQILRTAVDRGIGLEVNTSGWRQGLGESFPSLNVLRWYRELGGEILTVGSDSHRSEDLGSGIQPAYRMLLEAGFKWLTVFEKRKPRQLPLAELADGKAKLPGEWDSFQK